MKKHRWMLAAVLVGGLALATASCDKLFNKDNEEEGTTVQAFFTVQGGVYHEGNLPEPSGSSENQPEIQNVEGNTQVVPGGSNILNVRASDPQGDLASLLVSILNYPGYFSISWAGDSMMTITLILQSELPRDTFVVVIAVQDEAGHVSAWVQIQVITVEVVQGELQVTLTWDQPNDVDLHVVQPDGEEIFYGHTTSDEGGYLDLDSNAGCSIDGVNNEHITYPDTAVILTGEYIVRVDFWSNCEVSEPTHYSVTARRGGSLLPVTAGHNPYSGVFQPNDADYGGAGSGVEVMRFEITGGQPMLVWHYPQARETLSETARWKLEASRR